MADVDPTSEATDSTRADLETPPWRRSATKIVVVLPAFNEETDLGPLLERIDEEMFDDGSSFEIILVDDGSTDGTTDVAEAHARHMPIHIERHETNQGLGATIRDGLKEAAGRCGERDIVVVMDADNTHTQGLIRSMTRLVKEGGDVVIASRYQPGSLVKGVPLHRRILSDIAKILLRLAFPIHGVRDYTCGYRAYRGAVLKSAFDQYGDDFVSEEGFQCMVDILLKLRKMDLVFREVPLVLRYDLKEGVSKMKIMRTIGQTLALMARRWFQG